MHSLLGIDRLGGSHDFTSKVSLLCSAIQMHEINS